jgi:hypothetical protein
LENTNLRRQYQSVQSQSKPVYPSYHLEPTIPLPEQPRPTDHYRPLNILRSSPRQPLIRVPSIKEDEIPVFIPPEPPRLIREREEFIAVVFDNEVWMGLVDFKSDKQPPAGEEQLLEDDMGITLLNDD